MSRDGTEPVAPALGGFSFEITRLLVQAVLYQIDSYARYWTGAARECSLNLKIE